MRPTTLQGVERKPELSVPPPAANGRAREPMHAHALFQEPWWLEAAAPGRWGEVTVVRGGATLARLPYVWRGPRRFPIIAQPPFAPFLGPWMAPAGDVRPSKALGEQMELIAELEDGLPAAPAFRQTFSPHVMGVMPLLWAGYRATVRYTYRLADLRSEQALWDGLSQNIRRNVRKARRAGVVVRDDLGVDRLHEVLTSAFAGRRFRPIDVETLRRVDDACILRDARTSLFAQDATGRVHAVVYVVWDRHTAYYLFGGSAPEFRDSGAQSLLLWEAICRSRSRSAVFDFEGSMLRPVEKYFRLFGGTQTPYLQLTRATPAAAVALAAYTAWGERMSMSGSGR